MRIDEKMDKANTIKFPPNVQIDMNALLRMFDELLGLHQLEIVISRDEDGINMVGISALQEKVMFDLGSVTNPVVEDDDGQTIKMEVMAVGSKLKMN